MKNDKNEEEQNLKLEEPKIIENEKKVSTEKIEENKEVSLEINEMDKLINKINFNMCHVKIVILMALYCSVDGYVMIATSLLMPVIDKTWKLTEFEKGFIGGSIFLGFMLGALLVGFVSDRKGRKMDGHPSTWLVKRDGTFVLKSCWTIESMRIYLWLMNVEILQPSYVAVTDM